MIRYALVAALIAAGSTVLAQQDSTLAKPHRPPGRTSGQESLLRQEDQKRPARRPKKGGKAAQGKQGSSTRTPAPDSTAHPAAAPEGTSAPLKDPALPPSHQAAPDTTARDSVERSMPLLRQEDEGKKH